MKPRTTFLAASAGILLLGAGVPIVSAQADIYGTRQRPLEGRRYETMRAYRLYPMSRDGHIAGDLNPTSSADE